MPSDPEIDPEARHGNRSGSDGGRSGRNESRGGRNESRSRPAPVEGTTGEHSRAPPGDPTANQGRVGPQAGGFQGFDDGPGHQAHESGAASPGQGAGTNPARDVPTKAEFGSRHAGGREPRQAQSGGHPAGQHSAGAGETGRQFGGVRGGDRQSAGDRSSRHAGERQRGGGGAGGGQPGRRADRGGERRGGGNRQGGGEPNRTGPGQGRRDRQPGQGRRQQGDRGQVAGGRQPEQGRVEDVRQPAQGQFGEDRGTGQRGGGNQAAGAPGAQRGGEGQPQEGLRYGGEAAHDQQPTHVGGERTFGEPAEAPAQQSPSDAPPEQWPERQQTYPETHGGGEYYGYRHRHGDEQADWPLGEEPGGRR